MHKLPFSIPLLILLLLTLLTGVTNMGFAQKTSFDIASFTPPAGWQPVVNSNVVSFTTVDSVHRGVCILTVYRSSDGSGDADADFSRQWNDKAVRILGTSNNPHINKSAAKDGWQIRVGIDSFSKNGMSYLALLTVLSGYNKVMDIMVVTNRKNYFTTLDPFYKSIELDKRLAENNTTPAASAASAPYGSMNGLTYSLPKGWTEGRAGNEAITATSPLLECTDQSYYTLFVQGISNYDGDLEEYAKQLHKAHFYQPDPVFVYPEAGRRVVKGIDEEGREFLSYEAPSVSFKSDNCWHWGMVYLVRSGNQVAAFMLELRPQNRDKFSPPSYSTLYFLYNCNALRNAWNKFIASVKFNAQAQKLACDPADLVGNWESRITLGASIWGYVSSMQLQKYHFMEDGRWQSQYMSTENNYGKYRISGDKLVITDGAGKTMSYKLRLERVFEYATWNRYLYLYDSNGEETKLSFNGD